MICTICAEENPETNRYCGQCGGALDIESEKFRNQVTAIVQHAFKDQELVAVTIADKAEDRLWRLGKVLAGAGSLLGIALAIFGFTSIERAKSQIDAAALFATQHLSSTAASSEKTIDQQRQALLLEMQKQAQPTEEALQQFAAKTKATSAELLHYQALAQGYTQQMAQLKKIRETSPQTPIGDIKNDLFQIAATQYALGGLGAGINGGGIGSPYAANPYINSGRPPTSGLSATSAPLIAPYKIGSQGIAVEAIQARLAQLGCYSGSISGQYDSATDSAVRAFQGTKSTGQRLSDIKTPPIEPPPTAAPSTDDAVLGDVGLSTWSRLFSPVAHSCK
jgi:hypothetical protein